ncbi:hypothetical protein G9A89_005391 [Geosiphon pyriformis]|nr:hypothetical protein G9A89_005391 [Geosiphon pyriformis]
MMTCSIYITFWEPEAADFGHYFLLHQGEPNFQSFESIHYYDAQINDVVRYYCLLAGNKRITKISFLQSGVALVYDLEKFGNNIALTIPLSYDGLLIET